MPKRKWESTGFGERLKAIRESSGQSQQQLADATGVDVMTVSRLERGSQEPAWPLVLAFCEALGVNTEAFRPTAAPEPKEKPQTGRQRKAEGEKRPRDEDKAFEENLAQLERRALAALDDAPAAKAETGKDHRAAKKSDKRGGKLKGG